MPLSVLHMLYCDKCRDRAGRATAACHPLSMSCIPHSFNNQTDSTATLSVYFRRVYVNVYLFLTSADASHTWPITFIFSCLLPPSIDLIFISQICLLSLHSLLSDLSHNINVSFPYADKAVSYIYFPHFICPWLVSHSFFVTSTHCFFTIFNFCSSFITQPSFISHFFVVALLLNHSCSFCFTCCLCSAHFYADGHYSTG